MRTPFISGLVAVAFDIVTATHSANWCNQFFCISARIDSSSSSSQPESGTGPQSGNELVTFQVSARRDVGWLGVGSGYGMAGSKMVLLWKGGDGGCVVSERDGHGHSLPEITTNKTITLLPSANTTFLTCAYTLPTTSLPFFTTQDPTHVTEPMGMLWAYAETAPTAEPGTAAAESAKIKMHDSFGIFDLVFHEDQTTAKGNETSGKDAGGGLKSVDEKMERRARVIRAHVVFMSLGWMITAPIAVLIARFGRNKFTWLPSHQGLQCGTLLLVLIGYACAVAGNWMRAGKSFGDRHAILGVILTVLLLVQLSLGYWIHHLYNALRTRRPARNFLHIGLGSALLVGGFLNMRFGIEKWGNIKWMLVTYWTWLGLLIVAFLVGMSLLPRQLRQEAKALDARNPDIRLSRIQASFPPPAPSKTTYQPNSKLSPFSPATATPATAAELTVQYPWHRNARTPVEPYRDAASPAPGFTSVPLGRELVSPARGRESV